MQFRILGTVEVVDGHGPLPLGGPKQRAVLVHLLLRARQTVPTERLIDALWDGAPPASARASLHSYVSNLRRVVGDDRIPTGGGYVLEVADDEIDAHRFEVLYDQARGTVHTDPAAAIELLDEALALWRGHALEDVADLPGIRPAATRLDELRATARESWIDARMATGDAPDVIADLESLLAQDPLRERLWSRLLVALYRAGRQADALRAYDRARTLLADELGISPSRELQRVHTQVLRQDPGLDADGLPLRGYRLLEQLDAGPVSSRHRAVQPSTGRRLVVTIMGAQRANDVDVVRRFDAWARAISSLQHPHVVPLLDWWREPDAAYLVAPFLGGGTLAARLAGEPPDADLATRIVRQIDSALTAIHRADLVHGAVSANTVLLDEDLNAYLSDVGLASLLETEQPPTAADDQRGLRELTAALLGDGVIEHAGVARMPNPYKGLRAFGEADAVDFFGRGAATARLLQRMGEPDARFLAVVGPSGAGKSSLVRAGLLPALRAGRLPGSDEWLVITMSPRAEPFEELAAGLRSVAREPLDGLLTRVANDLGAALSTVSAGADLLLVIDQFEELFTLVADDTRTRFVEQLTTALERCDSRVRIAVTVRADFLDRLLQHPALAALLRDRTEFVAPLDAGEVAEAVTGPAARAGVAMEPALVAEIVRDATGQAGALPLLQYTLTELYDRGAATVSLADYRAIGGLTGALARRADDTLDRLSEASRAAARDLFLALVTVGDGGEDTTRRLERAELLDLTADASVMASTIEACGSARLLTFDHDPDSREPTVEVAHESLLHAWPTLRSWVHAVRADLQTAHRLAATTRDWLAADRDTSFLATGHRLAGFSELVDGAGVAVTDTERAYVAASIDERDRLNAEAVAREEEREHLRRRAFGRLRALLVVLAVAALAASGLSVYALRQRARADDQANAAAARGLASAAIANLDVDPQRSLLLAVEAVERSRERGGPPASSAVDALHRSVHASRLVRSLRSAAAPLAWHPDGAMVATTSVDRPGVIQLRDPTTWDVVQSARTPSARVTGLAFSNDGRLMVAAGDDGRVRMWDVAERRWVWEIGVRGRVRAPTFNRDGTAVAVSLPAENRIQILDAVDGATVEEVITAGPAVSLSIAPDGTLAYATDEPPQTVVVDPQTRDQRYEVGAPPGLVGAAFSPDGRWLATAADGLVDARAGTRVDSAAALLGVTVPTWTVDGRRLATGGIDGSAQVWDVADDGTLTEAFSLVGPTANAALIVSAISPDGTTVLTAAPAAGVHVWDVSERGGAEVAHLPADDEGHPGIAWSPDAGRLAVSAGDGDVALWDTATWSDQTVVSPGGIVDNIAWSPDGALIATASDGRATVWDANDRREVFAVAYGDDFGSVAWDPDGDNLAVVGYRQAIVVDRGGAEVARITAVPGLPEGVAFDRTGSLLGLAYELGDIAIWDWRAGELVWDDAGEFSNVAFDPTSARLVAAAVGGRTRVIEVPDGSVLAELRGHAAGVQHAAFSPDGGLIATAGFDATVRLWDAQTGAELLVLRGHDGLVHRVAFSPDGRWLASSSPADGVRVWALDVDDLLTIAREKVTRGFTTQECVQYLGGEPCE